MTRSDREDVGVEGTGRPERAELNGTFLVRPGASSPRRPPLGAAGELQSFRAEVQATAAEPASWPRQERVIDSGDLLPFHYLRVGDRMGRAVVKLQRDDGSTGTGFLVAPDVVLTNHHVLPTPEVAATTVALANYEVAPPTDPPGRPSVAPLDPSLMFVSSDDLDFTFCGVRGLEFLGAIPIDRERLQVGVDETVSIIQHPRGRPKEVALRENRVVLADDVVVQYSCDTEPGSSGSPVFNTQWKPVAIHHASVLTDSSEGRRVGLNSGARYLNEGIRLSAIAVWLDSAGAAGAGGREQVRRLRALFGGPSPRDGYFGAMGRRPSVGGETEAEGVEVLDVGSWDTRVLASASGGLRARAAELARAMADLGLDLWCLAQADADGLDALCDQLWTAHGLSYRAIGPIEVGVDLSVGVLVRQSRAVEVEPMGAWPGEPPPRLRVRAARRGGGTSEFQVVPMVRGPGDGPDLGAEAARGALRGRAPGGPDWVFLGDPLLVLAVEALGLVGELDISVIAATDDRDGAVAIVPDPASTAQIFVTPNLRRTIDFSGRLAVARPRPLPASVEAVGVPRPVALRIALDPAPTPAPAAPEPPPPPRDPALDALVERTIRDLIGPAVERAIAGLRASGAP